MSLPLQTTVTSIWRGIRETSAVWSGEWTRRGQAAETKSGIVWGTLWTQETFLWKDTDKTRDNRKEVFSSLLLYFQLGLQKVKYKQTLFSPRIFECACRFCTWSLQKHNTWVCMIYGYLLPWRQDTYFTCSFWDLDISSREITSANPKMDGSFLHPIKNEFSVCHQCDEPDSLTVIVSESTQLMC